jgi:O-succinylhomoserine sulfhydrylase
VSFEVVDKITAWRFIDALSLFTITANFGDTKSIVTHPASTTHGRLIQEDRDKMGITDGLVRLSIGLESVDDLINDIQQAIESLS